MLLRQIRCFLAVARAGSFTGAAAAMHLSQPALGSHVRQLEAHLGAALFERHARGARLTPAGAAFLPRAQAVLEAVAAAERAVSGLGSAPRRLALGVTPTPGQVLVPDLLQACAAASPPLLLSLRQGMSEELAAGIAAGTLDAALCYDVPLGDASRTRPLLVEDLFLVGPAALLAPLGEASGEVAFAELPRLPLLLDGRFQATRRKIEAAAAAEGVALSVRLEVGPSDMKRAVLKAHGAYATLVPHALFRDEIEAGRMRALRVVRPRIRRTLFLLTRRALPEALAAALDALLDTVLHHRVREGVVGWEAPPAGSAGRTD